jgi:hypothetical protein
MNNGKTAVKGGLFCFGESEAGRDFLGTKIRGDNFILKIITLPNSFRKFCFQYSLL